MRVRLIQSLFVLTTLTAAGAASAHFELTSPKPSSSNVTSGGKGGPPCGPDATAAATPIEVTGGTMLPIMINETTYHPGHYRVALAINSRDEVDTTKPTGLKEPVVKNAGGMVLENKDGSANSETAEIMNPPVFPVLADGLFPHTSDMSPFSGMVAIPNMTCAKCTLQVIEFMSKHGPDYFYRHCADIKITADPNKPIFNPNGSGGSGGMGGGGGSGGAGGASGGAGGNGGTGVTPMAGTGGVVTPVGGTGAAGTPTATGGGGSGTVGTGNAADDGSCSIGGTSSDRWLGGIVAGLLVGLGWLGRRRNRAG